MGIICCSCGRNCEVYAESNRVQPEQPWRHLNPWICEKNSSGGVKHGPSQRQKMFYQARQMLEKARQGKHGRRPTILSRWCTDEEYRKSLSALRWKEHHTMLYDRIAVEKHMYIAARAERIQNSKHWNLTINAEAGTQQSLNERPHFAHAERECKRLHDEHLVRTQEVYRAIPRSTRKTAKRTTFWGQRRIWLRGWPQNRLEVLQRVAEKPADNFVRIAGQLAISFVIVVNVGPTHHWKTGNWNSQHSSNPDDWWTFFSEFGQVSVAWRKKTPAQPTGGVNSTPTNTARTELHSMITLHHANTRGSTVAKLRIAHLRVLKHLSSTSHVSSFAAPDTDHQHKFSLTQFPLLLSFRRSHFCTQSLWFSTLIYPAMFHGRVADQHKSHLSHSQGLQYSIITKLEIVPLCRSHTRWEVDGVVQLCSVFCSSARRSGTWWKPLAQQAVAISMRHTSILQDWSAHLFPSTWSLRILVAHCVWWRCSSWVSTSWNVCP